MTTFSIKTLGCKVNQSESECIENRFISQGYRQAASHEAADLCIINTCTVTQKASMQSRQVIRKAIRENPNAKIVVTGCYAQTEPDVIKKIAGIHEIVGNGDKFRIPEIFANSRSSECNHHINSSDDALKSHSRTRPFLKIQDGCNASCSYCIVPSARGKSRSLPIETVIESISRLKDNGFHEIVLTGIHLGHYGLDLNPETSLTGLLKTIENKRLINRVRLSSVEPAEITDEILKIVAGSNTFCRHFHVPLQSGDNDVLRRMNRPYTKELFVDLVSRIHDLMPDAAIGTDVMAGFPGETEAAFENTFLLLQDIPITYLHVFPFSPRKGTPAYGFLDQIPVAVVKTRANALKNLSKSKRKSFYMRHVGTETEVIIEGTRDKVTGLLKAITSNYIPVMIDGEDHLKQTLAKIRIMRLQGENAMFGEIL